MGKLFNYLMHFISYDYCQKCYGKIEYIGELSYYKMPIANIHYYTMPEDEEFYLHRLIGPVDSNELPSGYHYAEKSRRMCIKCGESFVSFKVYLKAGDLSEICGEVQFPYREEYEPKY